MHAGKNMLSNSVCLRLGSSSPLKGLKIAMHTSGENGKKI
jgi:hypothetical protein